MATEKKSYSFPDTSTIQVPYTCDNKFVVQEPEQLKYHLLIDELSKNGGFYSMNLRPYIGQMNKEEKKAMSLAFLARAFYLEEQEEESTYDMYNGAGFIYPFLEKEDIDFAEKYLRIINDNSKDTYLVDEELFLEYIEKYSWTEKLSHTMIEELTRRFEHFEELTKSRNTVGSGYPRLSVLTGTLIGAYNSANILHETLDPSFNLGELDRRLSDGYPLNKIDPYYDEHLVLAELFQASEERYPSEKVFKSDPVYEQVMGSKREEQKNYLMATIYRIVWSRFEVKYDARFGYLANALVRRKLTFTEQEMIFIIDAYLHPQAMELHPFNIISFFKNVERHIVDNGLSEPITRMLLKLAEKEENPSYDQREFRKIKGKARELLLGFEGEEQKVLPFLFNEDDQLGTKINSDIASFATPLKGHWYDFLRVVSKAKGGKPTAKFLKTVGALIPVLGEKELATRVESWMNHIHGMEITRINEWYAYFISSNNVDTVKGLVWSLSLIENDDLYESLERMIIRCFKKIPGVGPSSGALGNACIYIVANKNSLSGVALLNRVRSKIAQRNTKALIDRYINAIAEKLQISVSDLEDFSIEDFGLNNGSKEVAFKDYTARLSLAAFGKTKLEWIKPDGKLQKSIPAFVRKEFAEELKELRSAAKLMPKTLTLQRDRLDRSYIQKRNFPYPHFQKYYLEHGLMSFLTQKLIWVFTEGEQVAHAIWAEGQWRDVAGNSIDWIGAETMVQLWHPLHCSTEEILQWREYLQTYEIKQPLKQAYREVYILTDAEINTGSYSNRMAAHILKQHQFNALAALRGWKYQLLGAYDDGREGDVCSIPLPDYELQAEFWINEINADDAFNDAGIWLYVATDQVRFVQAGEVLDLTEIPKIVFSEVMRDVDLFVGVGSVGNDPTWQDNGGLPQFNNYWESFSFGNLTELAKTRKVILEKLLPRLKIAKVASIKDRFLVVEGTKRTYKIHIGSTNILMEPNDQYLCIVPARSSRETKQEKLFIPFEGDRGLSILLSKAFMLAEDDKIEDKTILSQIN